ncbi:DnaJ-like protein [Chloropicon primus]|uniref:DnaJ-like protein n=1 Tax=Chloropicon primus TaxID=1764295 RepID=A0A5B8MLX0_9CHLO|nr:DnaJ-like protein [Chloropicon primus]UPR00475.1 DnaJ-like protein [Chloropicon primus]|mmetsp:Transcript_8486/g.24249  ORF Transcript_8486/g.24249 Transcript_8486/m.24249 type:complete len:249 (+) Transcript_8486:239-985(+)|eukprot:QDZ21261.1 DnaJ-like protein [Chloropicon primus]
MAYGGYANGTRFNHHKKREKRVWRREDHGHQDKPEEDGPGPGPSSKGKGGKGSSSSGGLNAEARPFTRLSAKAKPFAPLNGKLEEIERKKKELQEKIRAKKRKLKEDEVFKKRQQALRDAAKQSQDVAERRAKIARLQGGFEKVKKHMVDKAGGQDQNLPGSSNAQASNLKPTNKIKEVTREDVARVLHALNDYDVLEVNLASGSSEIRKNFLKLSRAFHPDKCRVDGSKEAFQRVSKAYTNLKKQHS